MKIISQWIIKMAGWEIVGQLPDLKHYIIIVCPHTSNWDFILGLLVQWSLELKGKYIGKHQLFRPPFGFVFRALGGFPVNREKSNNLVQQVADLFKTEKQFVLALAPEGHRKKVAKIKTGFYHIAEVANVPVVSVGFDFSKKQIIVTAPYYTNGDKAAAMQHFINFFSTIKGKYPEHGIDQNTTW
jgi:1-acyl-sn-glycerol-3-phosphate acyltransferase